MTRKTVTRTEITEALYKEVGLSRDHCHELLDSVLAEITKALVNNEEVKLSGFASFSTRRKKQRMGRNPKTREDVVIPPRKVVTFRASKNLKDRMNSGSNQVP
jgi:integration host factor subunit alpha